MSSPCPAPRTASALHHETNRETCDAVKTTCCLLRFPLSVHAASGESLARTLASFPPGVQEALYGSKAALRALAAFNLCERVQCTVLITVRCCWGECWAP